MTDQEAAMASNENVHPQNTPKAAEGSCCGSSHRDAGGEAKLGHDHHDHGRHEGLGEQAAGEHRVKDPVCGMSVDPHTAKYTARHSGQPYYFCSEGCRTKFLADPARYRDQSVAAAKAEPLPEGTIYTCPMHPQIRQVGPGSCPICGMALEPVASTAEAGANPELADFTRRFWIGTVLCLPVLALEMGGHMTGLHQILGARNANWLQFLIGTPVVLWAGWPLLKRGWQSVVK